MTREEAIANLNMISVAFVEPVTKEQRKLIDDTFEMAIKALEQEPCEDIKAEIKSLYAYYGDGSGWEESRNITLNEVMRIIDKHISGKEQA